MGEAYTAVGEGVDSLYWNPAGMTKAQRPTLMLSYNPLVQGMHFSQAAYSHKFRHTALALGYNGLTQNVIDSYDEFGTKGDGFTAADHLGVLGWAVGGKNLSMGISAKYWSSKINDITINNFGGDAGLEFKNPFVKFMQHSLSVRNVGKKVSFITQKDPLPLIVTFGNAAQWGHLLTVAGDVSQERGRGVILSGGTEWKPFASGFLALRGGYTTRRNEAEELSGASFGLGFHFHSLSLDYAWVPYGKLGDGHVMTLLWKIPELPKTQGIRSEPQSPPTKKSRSKKTLDDLDSR
jgi:hypothetical protein